MNPAKRREIFTRFRTANPHPTTELEYKTPFELLTNATTVNFLYDYTQENKIIHHETFRIASFAP